MTKVYDKIQRSTNDLPLIRVLKRLRQGTEQQLKSDRSLQKYLDSEIIHDFPSNPDASIDTIPPPYQHTATGEDDDNPQSTPNNTIPTINVTTDNIPAQNDSGTNRIVTDDINLLQNITVIDPLPMGGCNKTDDAAITCTAIGDIHIYPTDGVPLTFKAYYSKDVDGTIISPTAMVRQHATKYHGWIKYADCDSNKGTLKLLGRNEHPTKIFNIYSTNDLWYHSLHTLMPDEEDTAKLRPLSVAAKYELWHQRTAHAGSNVLDQLHKHAQGVPQLRGNAFYRCPSCLSGKLCTKRHIGKPTPSKGALRPNLHPTPPSVPTAIPTSSTPKILPGQHFSMDFGFVRGSAYNMKTEDGTTVTSIYGMNSYLSIIDRATRYMWVFPTKSKKPPIETVTKILNKFKCNSEHRTVRTDQGGELSRSEAFATAISDCGFTLEVTGSDASAQNGLVENPNRTLGQMMRCMLHSAELGPEYWSYAIQYAAYIRNRLPHFATGCTPFEGFTGNQPDLSGLRIFGSRVYARKPGKRKAKLDDNSYKGFFLGFTATDKNCRYIDEDTGRIKIATHLVFDEAHFSQPAHKAPLAAQTLQRLGYYAKEDWIKDEHIPTLPSTFNIQHLTPTAITPTRGTDDSIGYDLYLDSDKPIVIPAQTIMPLPTGIAIQCPTGTYARIAPTQWFDCETTPHHTRWSYRS